MKNKEETIKQLYLKYFNKIFRYIAWSVGYREITEDLTSKTFMKVVENIEKVAILEEKHLTNWIYKAARNNVIDHFRNRKVHLSLEYVDLGSDEIGLIDKEILREEFDRVRNTIEKLPEQQRDCIRLKYFSELSNKEVAEVMEISEKTVSMHLNLGRERIKELMK